jgi:hypothetical protein
MVLANKNVRSKKYFQMENIIFIFKFLNKTGVGKLKVNA